MTEQEIIEYWKNNRKEMRALAAAPRACREFIYNHRPKMFLSGKGEWIEIRTGDIYGEHSIITIDPDYKAATGKWVEFDIDKRGYFVIPNRKNEKYKKRRHFMNLVEASSIIGLFGGWLYESTWSLIPCGLNKANVLVDLGTNCQKMLMPTKIRFWVEE